MVFVEMDRNEKVLENTQPIIKDVENVTGQLFGRQVHIYYRIRPLHSEELEKYVILTDYYMTKEEWKAIRSQEAMEESVSLEQNCGCGNDPAKLWRSLTQITLM